MQMSGLIAGELLSSLIIDVPDWHFFPDLTVEHHPVSSESV